MIESGAKIVVNGVHRAPADEAELRTQLRNYYSPGNAVRDLPSAVTQFVETCVPLVLFDLTLNDLCERFRMGAFSQGMPAAPEKSWQRAYDEAVLSSDGRSMIARGPFCTRGLRSGRIAFYFHYYDPSRPMLWSYGQFSCPPVQSISAELLVLMPYQPVNY